MTAGAAKWKRSLDSIHAAFLTRWNKERLLSDNVFSRSEVVSGCSSGCWGEDDPISTPLTAGAAKWKSLCFEFRFPLTTNQWSIFHILRANNFVLFDK